MTRLFETQCVYCQAMAVLNNYCRQCESRNPENPNAISEQTTTESGKAIIAIIDNQDRNDKRIKSHSSGEEE